MQTSSGSQRMSFSELCSDCEELSFGMHEGIHNVGIKLSSRLLDNH